ncbi:MAG TPA: hypothetical protein PKG63_03315 [Bacteroidales bacterium]|jgi:hypothetical protein|nr:hypothetical protein [Bacteroidales bacterium]HOU98645.1 hypothetical protein [Bacteroidales bacterium]
MNDIQHFSIEIIKELEKKFKNACCNKTAEAYLDCALLIKHKLKEYESNQNLKATNNF